MSLLDMRVVDVYYNAFGKPDKLQLMHNNGSTATVYIDIVYENIVADD